MKFFIDTANLKEIADAHSLGLVDGVTTNPSLSAKEGVNDPVDFRGHILEICKIVHGPESAEVVATETDAMVTEATNREDERGAITPLVAARARFRQKSVSASRRPGRVSRAPGAPPRSPGRPWCARARTGPGRPASGR